MAAPALAPKQDEFITALTFSRAKSRKLSLFRHYQNVFLERFGPELRGNIVELGGEKEWNHKRFFPNASTFKVTNIARSYEEYLDITNMHYLDNSQDGYVCISVLQHVPTVERALAEMRRTLKPGGALLMTNAFGFPQCDVVDYWRMSRSFYDLFEQDYDVKSVVRLGGRLSTVVESLMRPRSDWSKRYAVYKCAALALAAALGRYDAPDGFPLGIGILATKR